MVLSIDLKKRNEGVGGKLKGEQIYGHINDLLHCTAENNVTL